MMQLEGISEKGLSLGGINWKILLFFIICWVLIYFSIWKGIKVSTAVAKVSVISPYIFLTILFVNVLTLPGALKGLKYLLVPKISEIFKIKTWYYAMD